MLPKVVSVITLILSFILMGCKKDEKPATQPFISAKIDGVSVKSNSVVATKTAGGGSARIIITGTSFTNGFTSIVLDFQGPDPLVPGIYSSSLFRVTKLNESFNGYCLLNVTAIDNKQVEGTFTATLLPANGTGPDGSLEEGKFYALIQ